ncbi:YodL domain-containing protein [Lacrimispora indolis]|uniref:YodL domain-containing protein n=1 Tax=Lacrimispora indolis TaxID=69825 RepID=UPI00356ACC61
MASLRDTVKDYQEELRDGIAWVAFWKTGRSWNAEYFHLEMGDYIYPEDRSRMEEIKQADPAAVVVNGYYSGYLGEDMSLDELTAGVRRHYENGYSNIREFIEAHDDRLPPELIEEARAAAHAAGLPFSEKAYRDGEEPDPYIFDGSMSMEDYELMHRMIENERSERMAEIKTGYSTYDHDRLDPADSMRIERKLYFEQDKADISGLIALSMEQLREIREESAAAEQTIYEDLKQRATAWEAQAGQTLAVDKAIEYVRTPEVKHTANQWEAAENDRHIISNRVYQMRYHIYENTRYDREKGQSVPYAWTLSWNVYTNSPDGYNQAKIAGQEKKFADRAAMEKYLNGRIKAYQHLFTEISPPIPKEYAYHFKINGQLLPGYTIEGEEREQPTTEQAAPAPTEPPQNIGQRNEPEQFAILIDSRSRFETGEPGGVWLSMPTTKEQLHEAMRTVGITADNPQDFFINGYSDNENRHIALPYDMVCAADIDSLNLLAARIAQLDPAELPKLNAALQQKQGFENIGQIIDFTYNVDYFVHISGVNTSRDLGDYYLNKSGMVQMPEEWKNGVDLAAFGKNAAEQEQGSFTPYGYLVKSGDEWERHFEGRELPEEYRIMSYPKPEQSEQDKIFMDAAATEQTAPATAIEPQKPRPVIPIVLTSEKPAEKMKEITDRLEQGITELFDSERYKEYLKVMSRFHNYSFNNTLLIAMQKPDASLVAGFTAWKNNFQRNVIKGEKGIKIIAPSPFKVKQQTEKIDPHTRKPVMGKDGKPAMEEKEVTIPAYKVVSVFDVSQTEGKELPDIAVDELTGDVERYKDFFTVLEKTSPVPIGFEKIIGGAHGYYHLEDKRIAIDEGMSELQTLKTAIHEIAHAKLHDIDLNAPKDEQQPRVDRRTREVEAESVAYTVCQHYGLDTSDYSFGYVAGWSSGRELAELKGSLETIRSTAAEIINSIDAHIAQIQKEQDKEQAAPAQEQPEQEVLQDKDTFSIYQINGGDETRDLRFEPYDRLTATGHRVDPKNYALIYSAELTPGTSLEDIYTRFNIDHPKDFKGHSLSVSDVVVLHQNGQDTAHYVDSFGYKDVPEFFKTQEKALIPDNLETGETIKTPRGTFYVTAMSREQMEAAGYGLHHQSDDGKYLIMGNGTRAFAVPVQPENYLKAAEQTTEQNYNMIDGQINNTPTVAELEAKVKAGETISLVDLAEAVKADKERGKAVKTEKKPSIRAQLRADKEKTAQKKAAKTKNHELEV